MRIYKLYGYDDEGNKRLIGAFINRKLAEQFQFKYAKRFKNLEIREEERNERKRRYVFDW